MILRALLALALLQGTPLAATPQSPATDPVTELVLRLEEAVADGNPDGIRALAAGANVPGLEAFLEIVEGKPTRAVIKNRDRAENASGERLLLEVFAEYGDEAAITTWRAEVSHGDGGESPRLHELERLTVVSGLHRLTLNTARSFEVHNLRMRAVDLTIELPKGSAYLADTADGPTAVVLVGRGQMQFSPSDAAERTQVRLFSGSPTLSAEFDAVFVRVRPSDLRRLFGDSLVEGPASAATLRRATEMFEASVGQTYRLDLGDLSRDRWSLLPLPGDIVVETRTRRFGTLTYTRSGRDPEDISLFDRRRRKNISIYASPEKLATRGPFYSEDDLSEYDILHYDVDASFTPDRLWIEGRAQIRLKVRAAALASLSLRLAEPLVVRSVVAADLGRLLHLRVVGQNSVIVNLPTSLSRDDELVLLVTYGGRLEPQQIEREGIAVSAQGGAQAVQEIYIPIEPQWLYSNRSYWYPQGMVTDFATAALRISVPAEYEVVATGMSAPASDLLLEPGERPRRLFSFEADPPARYLALVISRFAHVASREIRVPALSGSLTRAPGAERPEAPPAAGTNGEHPDATDLESERTIALAVHANPRQVGRARSLVERVTDMLQFYARLVGDAPYPGFTLAITENDLPGGHSPAYFAVLNEPSPLSPLVWRNDPVAFDSYAPFFLAHEVAHQWWGQAVGWKNYHEQWLSEGFAQYFAVMYAAHDRGADQQASMLRQMRRWAIEHSSQGPVYLGYRLGHIRSDGRVFRALVYNKGAMVLHMLRRLVGDEAFLDGIRRYYADRKFRKAGTDDLRRAMEAVSGLDLAPFFDGWIYGSAIPVLRFSSQVHGAQATLRFEHRGDVVPTPVTVSVSYADGRSEEVVVPVDERVVERTLPLAGAVRSIEVNRDHAALAEFVSR